MDHIPNRPWTEEVSWPGKTLILFQMIKRLAFGAIAGALALGSPVCTRRLVRQP